MVIIDTPPDSVGGTEYTHYQFNTLTTFELIMLHIGENVVNNKGEHYRGP